MHPITVTLQLSMPHFWRAGLTTSYVSHQPLTTRGLSGANTGHWGKVSWENYSRAIHLILMGLGTFSDGENRPVQLDFTNRRLIGIGHSLGAVSL